MFEYSYNTKALIDILTRLMDQHNHPIERQYAKRSVEAENRRTTQLLIENDKEEDLRNLFIPANHEGLASFEHSPWRRLWGE